MGGEHEQLLEQIRELVAEALGQEGIGPFDIEDAVGQGVAQALNRDLPYVDIYWK